MNRMATIDKVFILICFLSPKIPGQLDTIERGVNKFILTSVPGRPYASWATSWEAGKIDFFVWN